MDPPRNLDTKLLRVFACIYQSGSVSVAARELDMSQPGLSTALMRLREQLQDPLFTRTTGGMEPTRRARALIGPVRQILQTLDKDLLAPPQFDPATSTKEFRLALSDIGEGIYLPLAIRSIQYTAPGISLRTVVMPPRELEEAMASGEVDLAAGFFPDIRGTQVIQRRVGLHSFSSIARVGHPAASEPLTVEQYAQLGHIVVEAPGRSQEVFDQFLREKRIRLKVLLRTPHFMSVPIVVAETDAVAIVPQALADFVRNYGGIQELPMPFVPPTFQVNLFWHRSAQNDPSNMWLRELMISQFPALRARRYARNGEPRGRRRA
ncbi:LysR family transcriptional regulator [Ramlibacter henchirensis]|uniref:LysR family transcriptional regulator n=1 Tax=Ramlibacter henchirensis TaxID=204072 RepID=A0A4Z0C2H7_9BURK|nr:LysR family transcriptional regulator [Ramlibacter henchirensis]TFZ05723.1 LysR family transcriptional regulator [Ramlibacter henchirensis]